MDEESITSTTLPAKAIPWWMLHKTLEKRRSRHTRTPINVRTHTPVTHKILSQTSMLLHEAESPSNEDTATWQQPGTTQGRCFFTDTYIHKKHAHARTPKHTKRTHKQAQTHTHTKAHKHVHKRHKQGKTTGSTRYLTRFPL